MRQSLPKNVRKEAVGPLASIGVQHSVQGLFADGFRIDYMRHSLHSLKTLQGFEQHSPGSTFTRTAGTHHHKPVVEIRDLIQLEYLSENCFDECPSID